MLTFSQMSLNIKALFGQSKTLDTVLISQNGFQASLEYGFRLKQKRLEFHPGLGYRITLNRSSAEGYFHSLDMDLNTSVYPFDFAGDCHCPTFSKEGKLFKKGFFLEVSPGLSFQSLQRLKAIPDGTLPEPIKSSNVVLKIGGSVGLDIGITEEFTLTPMFSLTTLSADTWDGLRQDGSPGALKDFSYLGAGIRLAYKADPRHRRRF
jgi:hypothetical protein